MKNKVKKHPAYEDWIKYIKDEISGEELQRRTKSNQIILKFKKENVCAS